MNYDLIIVGGGPAGLCLARAARGLSVALVAQARPAPAAGPDAIDTRVYALSPGNVDFLREIKAWQALPAERLAPVHAMRVFGDKEGGSIEFDAYRAGAAELAWTVEDGLLQEALWRSLEGRDRLDIFAPAECRDLALGEHQVSLRLSDGRALTAALIVGADGAGSFVRSRAGIEVAAKDYGQAALVANFECEKPHANIAYQWFQGGPVLAFLPLAGKRISMIWSLPSAQAERMAGLDARALCETVEAATRSQFGALTLITPSRFYPLRRLAARRLIAPRVALVGDAAHVIHPLAGQGLNLALQDVRALAAILEARGQARDVGNAGLLRQYERSRAEPILAMDLAVDGLFRLFAAQGGAAGQIRNTGLNLANRIPVLKNILIRHAMN